MTSSKLYHLSDFRYPYPFGSSIKSRSFSAGSGFRFGFNTQEKDKEIYNNNETYTATFWEYDGRLGRRWNVDPLSEDFPWQSTYSSFNNDPIKFSDINGLSGEDKVAPAGHKEHNSVNNNALYLPTSAKVEMYNKTQKTTLANNINVKVNTIKGTVRSFTIGNNRYVASFEGKSGHFMGYKNFNTGKMYINPKSIKTTGVIAKVGFGETRGLYPSKGGEMVDGDPANWDFKASQELMSARRAIEVVAKRNSSVHPGATPNTNPNNVESKQLPFAIQENFPPGEPLIENDKTVRNFYNASFPDFIPGNSYVNKKYWDISIVKSYGPFYNASSLGDTKKGKPVYIIFYSVRPKQ